LVYTGDYQEDMRLREEYSEKMKQEAANDRLMLKNKWTAYQEYILFGDPGLNLYLPDE
jgi:hypothetical protein